MKVLHVTAEAVPFVKTGGLGEVVTPLAASLARQGNEVALVLPAYRCTKALIPSDATRHNITVPMPFGHVTTSIIRVASNTDPLTFYLVDYPNYFDREGLYGDQKGNDYADNSERFSFLCRAALALCDQLGHAPDIFHSHDWQAALVPTYVRLDPSKSASASVLTIHNLAFQGNFDFDHWHGIMLEHRWRAMDGLEFYGLYSHLKGGIIHADAINTVSPRYASEILTNDFGFGFDGLLRSRKQYLRGILNGIDTNLWNPANDPYLERGYDVHSWKEGKRAAKRALGAEANLEEASTRPLVAMIGRLTMQKGFDLFCAAAEELIHRGSNVMVLATNGSHELEMPLWTLAQRFPMRASVYFGFNEPLAHRVYAAADILAIPSRFEPCGLTQMIAMRYGTVPIARAVGGLFDTVVDTTPSNLAKDVANGFVFQNASIGALNVALQRALYAMEKPKIWEKIVQRGMATDFSWDHAAKSYQAMYNDAIQIRRNRLGF
jgi:starch synthase